MMSARRGSSRGAGGRDGALRAGLPSPVPEQPSAQERASPQPSGEPNGPTPAWSSSGRQNQKGLRFTQLGRDLNEAKSPGWDWSNSKAAWDKLLVSTASSRQGSTIDSSVPF